MSMDLGELLNLLVSHHAKLNELHVNGNFRSQKYKRHRKNIDQIQKLIKEITDRQQVSNLSDKMLS
jgi:DNA polymerase/3'-5' exonuclease PolX